MKLRIVSGSLSRRYVTIPSSMASFRPTLERTRESVFQSICARIAGARAADICAGSGAAGFELVSRGAKHVHFVEPDRKLARLIGSHAEKFGVSGSVLISATTVQAFLRRNPDKYDIIYYDPPYRTPELSSFVEQLRQILSPEGLLLYERATNDPLGSGVAQESRRYGDSTIDFIFAPSKNL